MKNCFEIILILLAKLKGNPFNISITVVYMPIAQSTEEEINKFYNTLENTKSQCKQQEITNIMGDLNAKIEKK